jgi:hypothetical protein
MHSRRSPLLHLLLTLLLAMLAFSAVPAHAVQTGEQLVNSSGTLSAGQTFTTPLYSPNTAANIRLHVDGGSPTDTITMKLLNGISTVKTWVVRSGETSWGYATFPASNGKLSLHNDSGQPLTYALVAYARGVAPGIAEGLSAWTGTARGAGIQSSIQLNVASADRYRFSLGATGGSYQIKVDANYVLKTVVPGNAPNANDSVYYLAAGIHTFTVVQDSAASQVNWSLALAALGGNEVVPIGENSKVLGGGAFFTDEWIPMHIAAAQPVNLSITATGRVTDSLVVELYNGATKVFISTKVFGGEVSWWHSSLAAGGNMLRVMAAGNSAALSYAISIKPIAKTPFTWSGVTYGTTARANSGHSSVQLTFPTSGLYRFTLGASAGRYQLLLDNHYLQKTVSQASGANITAFVPSGTHTLVVAQDPAAASTTWSVAIASATSSSDSLPFTRVGGELGGTSNAFREEWLPLRAVAGSPVNVRVTATGAAADSVRVELYNGANLIYSAAKVYGGEVFWGTSSLTAGTNLLHIVAASGNTGQMGYNVDVRSVASIPSTWQGVARGNGLNSVFKLNAPVSGTYVVTLTVSEGAGQVMIDQTSAAMSQSPTALPPGSTTVLRVPLLAGPHTFKLLQDLNQPRTIWQIASALRRADGVDSAFKVYVPLIVR